MASLEKVLAKTRAWAMAKNGRVLNIIRPKTKGYFLSFLTKKKPAFGQDRRKLYQDGPDKSNLAGRLDPCKM